MLATLLIGALGLLFAIEDLVGRDNSIRLETFLLRASRIRVEKLRSWYTLVERSAAVLVLAALSLLLSVPYFVGLWVSVFDQPLPIVRWETPWWIDIPLVILGVLGAFIATSLITTSFEDLRLPTGKLWEERTAYRLAKWVRDAVAAHLRLERKRARGLASHNPIGPDFPVCAAPIAGLVLLTLVAGAAITRTIALVVAWVIWAVWGIPANALRRLADRLGNPSMLKVGKWILALVAIILAAWRLRNAH